MTQAQRKAQTPTTSKTAKKQTFKGSVIYVAFNDITRKMEIVYPESEIGESQMVMPMFWDADAERYMTVPGTEVYGYVPA